MTGPAIRIDTTSPVPPFEQIRAQLASLIRSGSLAEGDRLPPVRQLATDLGLAAGTVARAYRELEAAALIKTRRGAGTRVAPLPKPTPDDNRPHPDHLDHLTAEARAFVEAARHQGADDTTILNAIHTALAWPEHP